MNALDRPGGHPGTWKTPWDGEEASQFLWRCSVIGTFLQRPVLVTVDRDVIDCETGPQTVVLTWSIKESDWPALEELLNELEKGRSDDGIPF